MAVNKAHMFPGFRTPVLTQLSFQSHQLLFSQASAELQGKITQERKFASTGYRTYNHQVIGPTCSPLSHRGWAIRCENFSMTQTMTRPLELLQHFNIFSEKTRANSGAYP